MLFFPYENGKVSSEKSTWRSQSFVSNENCIGIPEALSDEELEQIVTVWTRKPRRIAVWQQTIYMCWLWLISGVLGVRSFFFTYIYIFMCSCVYMYLEQDSQVLEQLKMSISRYTYFYIMYLCHSIYFTLPRGGSSPPLVHLEEMIPTSQYLYIISKCSSFQALYLTS